MGFSAWGLAVALAVFAPNLLLIRFPPRPGIENVRTPLVVTVLEHAGQALCVTVPAITVGSSLQWGWFIPVVLFIAAYWALWARYLATGRRWASLFGPVLGIPVPMALLPVAVFLAASVWLGNPWVAVAAVVLAAGHIPSSLITARTRERTAAN